MSARDRDFQRQIDEKLAGGQDVSKNDMERYKDTIVAIGYAERQMADSLKKAGKVKVEL